MSNSDTAILLLRIAFGAMMAYHGFNKIKSRTALAGTQGWFESMGMRWSALQARIAAFSEIIAGLLLAFGLFTDVACIVVISLMLVAIYTVHGKVGFFIFLPNGGWEYCAAISVVSTAISLLGPGKFSIDEATSWPQPFDVWVLPIAIGLTVCHLAISYRPKKLS